MEAAAVQFDLFFAAAPPRPAAAPPPLPQAPAPRGPVEPFADWAARKIDLWFRRAAGLRCSGEPTAALRAAALEWHVARLRGGSPAAAADAKAAEIEALRARVARWSPRFDERLGVAVCDGPISSEIRAQAQARLAELEALA